MPIPPSASWSPTRLRATDIASEWPPCDAVLTRHRHPVSGLERVHGDEGDRPRVPGSCRQTQGAHPDTRCTMRRRRSRQWACREVRQPDVTGTVQGWRTKLVRIGRDGTCGGAVARSPPCRDHHQTEHNDHYEGDDHTSDAFATSMVGACRHRSTGDEVPKCVSQTRLPDARSSPKTSRSAPPARLITCR